VSDGLVGQTALRRSSGNGGGQEQTAALWAALMDVSLGEAWLRRDEPKSAELMQRYNAALAELDGGAPLAYAVGSAAFRTLNLNIDRRALIPRPETEGLIDLVLARASSGLAADIGTGSGCIALSLAVEGTFEKVVAVEQSPDAAALARENVARINPATPVEIREGNLLEPLVDKGERYRVIVSNPPYLTAAEYDALDQSVRDFEPRDALVSGTDGLRATRTLFAEAGALLEPAGILALEIDERRADAVRALGEELGWSVAIHEDLFHCPRYALSTRED
jgi:release factor glutamine methyltransferase